MSIFIVGLFIVVGFVLFIVISKNDLGITSLNDTEEKKSNVVPSKSIYSTKIEGNAEQDEEDSKELSSSSENQISIEDASNTSEVKSIDN